MAKELLSALALAAVIDAPKWIVYDAIRKGELVEDVSLGGGFRGFDPDRLQEHVFSLAGRLSAVQFATALRRAKFYQPQTKNMKPTNSATTGQPMSTENYLAKFQRIQKMHPPASRLAPLKALKLEFAISHCSPETQSTLIEEQRLSAPNYKERLAAWRKENSRDIDIAYSELLRVQLPDPHSSRRETFNIPV